MRVWEGMKPLEHVHAAAVHKKLLLHSQARRVVVGVAVRLPSDADVTSVGGSANGVAEKSGGGAAGGAASDGEW